MNSDWCAKISNRTAHASNISINSTVNTNSTKTLIPAHFILQFFFLRIFGECNDFFEQIHLPLSHRNPACAAAMHGSKRTERWKKNVWHHSKRPHFRIKRFHSLNGEWQMATGDAKKNSIFIFFSCFITVWFHEEEKKYKLLESFEGKRFDWLITSEAQKIKSIQYTYVRIHTHIQPDTASESQSTETKTLRKHSKNENWAKKNVVKRTICAQTRE